MGMEIDLLYSEIRQYLQTCTPPLQERKAKEDSCEFAGTKAVMQGRQKVDGHYFASMMIKPKDVRFYFFPIYTHPKAFEAMSPALNKCLKGKSCFHLKNIDEALLEEIKEMIKHGVWVYQENELI